ncbi:hypothetical protein MPTK1_6g17230 [Marchantia polymorpha subsp. ruderalis]|nr:hypothetical protein MARPO_0184s0027 [Marchantia polymorpha]BBN15122.1 hypothetical protein Mp_6g17230 [Marchantia polymorpha subsp. ruderalis]|eukprot:PTQ27790.1 hypothetical protein MARPO_0184s0027 [Marchantia polymorpha]
MACFRHDLPFFSALLAREFRRELETIRGNLITTVTSVKLEPMRFFCKERLACHYMDDAYADLMRRPDLGPGLR